MPDELVPHLTPARVKRKPVLYVRFTGGDISPERVSLSALTQTLNAIRQLSSNGVSHHTHTSGEPADPGMFQLVGVKRGSALYQFDGRTSGLFKLRDIGHLLENPEAAGEVDFNFRAITELSSVTTRLRCKITIGGRLEDGKLVILARIGPDTWSNLRNALFVEGDTSIFGTVKRVGGATEMRCSIRLPPDGRLLYCKVDGAELSRRLGRYLYEDVLLNGSATWLRSNWRIVDFIVRSVSQPKQGNIVETFEALRDAGGDAWDAIVDPQAFLDPDRSQG